MPIEFVGRRDYCCHLSGKICLVFLIIKMPASAEAEKALPRFVEAVSKQLDLQDQLNKVNDLDGLRSVVQSIEPTLTGSALIPMEQATRPPKILVDSGHFNQTIPWRLLRCTGGPLVLQIICNEANFAIWVESC